MDATTAVALAASIGHSLPSGLADALLEIDRLRAENADLRAENARLQQEKGAAEEAAKRGLAPLGRGTWLDALRETTDRIDELEEEADKWYERYARATRCPPRRSLGGPYARPGDRSGGGRGDGSGVVSAREKKNGGCGGRRRRCPRGGRAGTRCVGLSSSARRSRLAPIRGPTTPSAVIMDWAGWRGDYDAWKVTVLARGLPARVMGVELMPPWDGRRLLSIMVEIDEADLPRSHAQRGFALHLSLLFEDELTEDLALDALRLHNKWAGRHLVLDVAWVGSGGAAFLAPTDPLAADAHRLHSAGWFADRGIHISL